MHGEDSTAEITSGSSILALLSGEMINNISINNCFVLLISIHLAYNTCLYNAQSAQTKGSKQGWLQERTFWCRFLLAMYPIFSPDISSIQLIFPGSCCEQNRAQDHVLLSSAVCCPWQCLALTILCMNIAFKPASLHAAGNAEAGYHRLAGFLCICHQSCPLDNISMIALHKVKLKCKLTYSPCSRLVTLSGLMSLNW